MDYKKSYKCKEKKSKNQLQDLFTRKKTLTEPPFNITCTANAYSRTHRPMNRQKKNSPPPQFGVSSCALAPKALRKWHLRSVKKPFSGEPKKNDKNIVKARSIKRL